MPRRLTAAEVDALADSLRALLASIATGELSASTSTVRRLEGATAVLEAVAGANADDLIEQLTRPRPGE